MATELERAISEQLARWMPADPQPALAQAVRYVGLVEKWNRSIRLVSFEGPVEFVHRHLIDGIVAAAHVAAGARVLDVGAGCGIPGAVVALLVPTATVVALEPVHKKHAFLATVRRELGLANFEPRAGRLEDLSAPPFDVAMSRATFALPEWLARATGRLAPGGLAIGFEGREQVELPVGAVRAPYAVEDRSRALVLLRAPT